MGHNEKFCHKNFDTPLERIEKPYGIWMKAEPRRRNHTIMLGKCHEFDDSQTNHFK